MSQRCQLDIKIKIIAAEECNKKDICVSGNAGYSSHILYRIIFRKVLLILTKLPSLSPSLVVIFLLMCNKSRQRKSQPCKYEVPPLQPHIYPSSVSPFHFFCQPYPSSPRHLTGDSRYCGSALGPAALARSARWYSAAVQGPAASHRHFPWLGVAGQFPRPQLGVAAELATR